MIISVVFNLYQDMILSVAYGGSLVKFVLPQREIGMHRDEQSNYSSAKYPAALLSMNYILHKPWSSKWCWCAFNKSCARSFDLEFAVGLLLFARGICFPSLL